MASAPPAGPICPRCRRKLAAWRLDHCIYCGEKFPENIREGFAEPEALKFIQRPDVPSDAVKQLEMLKHLEAGTEKKPKTLGTVLVLLTLPVFLGIFYLVYKLMVRTVPQVGIIVALLALAFLGYVVWTVTKGQR